MSGIPPNQPVPNDSAVATFEYTRMQLCGSLTAVAGAMRDAATFAEQFSQLIRDIPYHPGHPGFFPPNGQFLQLPSGPVPTLAPNGGKRKARENDDVHDGKKKRKTKTRDPNAPKRPPSSYLMFQNDIRQELKLKHPNLPNNELLGMIAKAWGEMPKERKDEYEERQKVAKDKYLQEKASYDQSLLPGADAASSPATSVPAQAVLPEPVESIRPEVVQPAPPTPVITTTDEESSDESESDSESGKDAETSPPPSAKRSRQTAIKTEATKEKKHKKSKA